MAAAPLSLPRRACVAIMSSNCPEWLITGVCDPSPRTYTVAQDRPAQVVASACGHEHLAPAVAHAAACRARFADFACALDDFMTVGIHVEWDQAKIEQILEDANVACVVASEEARPAPNAPNAPKAPNAPLGHPLARCPDLVRSVLFSGGPDQVSLCRAV